MDAHGAASELLQCATDVVNCQQHQGEQLARLAEEVGYRSGTTLSSKVAAMATRSCLRAILGTAADGGPCATVMPLPLASALVASTGARPDNGLRVICDAESLEDRSRPDQSGSSLSPPDRTPSCPVDGPSSQPSPSRSGSPSSSSRASGDVFLSASIQLAHLQSDTHQRVRQLWHTVQRLRWEDQISDIAVDALHKEMLALAKCTSAEKLDSSKFTKTGYLRLAQAPLSATTALKQQSVKMLFGTSASKSVGQLVWCALSEEHARFEMSPVREASSRAPAGPAPAVSDASPPGKSTLANSLMGIFSDAFQSTEQESVKRTLINLHGCHVRTVPTATAGLGSDDLEMTSETAQRFQILVPRFDTASRASGEPSHAIRSASYDIYVLEAAADARVPSTEEDGDSSSVVSSWVRAIDRVCMFHLYKLEERVRGVEAAADYRDVLSRSFPLTIPLTWLRNRQDRVDLHGAGEGAGYHEEELRRASRNVTMAQIIKDLERDRVLLDQRLLCPVDKLSAPDAGATLDTVSEIFKYLVAKVMASSIPAATGGGSRAASSSPSRRFAGFNEAKAVAFVELVLRGCSRTQSGGDIYDTISFLCQNQRVSICPLSQEACPVQISTPEEGDPIGGFRVEVKVRMSFKVVELTPTTPTSSHTARKSDPGETGEGHQGESDPAPRRRRSSVHRRNSLPRQDSLREWAVVEGTLVRHFTPGKASTPGCVTVDFAQREAR